MALIWSAVASEARHRFGFGQQRRRSQSAVVAALCRRTPHGGTGKMRPYGELPIRAHLVGTTILKGWQSLSPGLRGTSYPGNTHPKPRFTLKGLYQRAPRPVVL